jgi:hypothetical protein
MYKDRTLKFKVKLLLCLSSISPNTEEVLDIKQEVKVSDHFLATTDIFTEERIPDIYL